MGKVHDLGEERKKGIYSKEYQDFEAHQAITVHTTEIKASFGVNNIYCKKYPDFKLLKDDIQNIIDNVTTKYKPRYKLIFIEHGK